MMRSPPRSPLFPYPPLFGSIMFFGVPEEQRYPVAQRPEPPPRPPEDVSSKLGRSRRGLGALRSEKHTTENQTPEHFVKRPFLEKKKFQMLRSRLSSKISI